MLLLCSISANTNGALAFPVAIPKHPPGSRVVIVVGGNGSDGMSSAHPLQPPPSMMTSESQINQIKSMSLFPTQEQIKRQGLLSIKASPAVSTDLLNKREKSWSSKHVPSSPRHISGVPSDIFRQGKMLSIEKHTESGPQITDFRPHQPDITHHMQNNNGKLSLPIGFTDDNGLGGGGLGSPSPTPMANKINPYTNGVAASFPPGIDPYEGFIRYAAENLDTPMGNIVDYHSLEHYYGQQHPLSPYQNSKEAGNLQNHPYADSFSYNNNEIETGNSPPPPPPPHSPPPDGFGDGPGPGPGPGPSMGDSGGGFRPRHNSLDRGHSRPRENYHHSMTPQYTEHGIDHFHAPSPGLGAAPPRPRPPSNFDPALHEEEHGHRSPPFEPPPGFPQYTQNHHSPPFKHHNSAGLNSANELGHAPDPPDLDVYEEGPPPPGSHPPLPDPTHQGQNPNHSPPGPEQENNDGGDDAIWGILDLAEMLEKGQIPGQSGNTASASPTGAGGKNTPKGRLVVPVFTRPPPPRMHSSPNEGPSEDPDDAPAHIPPSPNHSNAQQTPNGFPGGIGGAAGPGSNDGGFDYDETPGSGGGGRPGFGGSLDSQEANDYGDDVYSK